jgi:hypothetical protein
MRNFWFHVKSKSKSVRKVLEFITYSAGSAGSAGTWKCWNSLPIEIRELGSLSLFKSRLEDHLWESVMKSDNDGFDMI